MITTLTTPQKNPLNPIVGQLNLDGTTALFFGCIEN
jgi:hypothetical protein